MGQLVRVEANTFQQAAVKHWKVWLENHAARMLTAEESKKVRHDFREREVKTNEP